MPEALNYNGEVRPKISSATETLVRPDLLAQFLIPWARLGRCRAEAYDDALGERLWKWLEDEVKGHQL